MFEEVTMQPPPDDLFPTLADLRKELTVAMLKQRSLLTLITRKQRFTQAQVAILSDRSPTTIKREIKAGRLKALPSGWISRRDLLAWLEYDPIAELADSICRTENARRRITRELDEG
jgi:hypothetical protein